MTGTADRDVPSPPKQKILDESYFNPSEEEWAFLKTTICRDEKEIRRRVLEAQKE